MEFLTTIVSSSWGAAIAGLALGVLALWFCSSRVVTELGPIARYFGVNELVVTILGISVLSSMPELMVSAIANLNGESEISIGNIIGSNFVTLTFVTAVCAMISPLRVDTRIRERESAWMILSTVIILVLAMDGELSRLDGALLIAFYLPYIGSVIREGLAQARASRGAGGSGPERGRVWPHILIGVVSVFGIIIGAQLTLTSGQEIGLRAGISPLVLGVLVLAFGTSLPELSVSLAATLRNKGDVSIGEVYASNIFTAMFVLGLCCLMRPMPVSEEVLKFDIPFLILAGSVVQIFITTGQRLVRLEALAVLGMYAYFVLGHFYELPFFT
jgi:cation:H+ antiporter